MTLIATLGSKGGVGKTTSIALIAEQLTRRGLPLILADADPQGSLLQMSKHPAGHIPPARPVFPIQFQDLAESDELIFLDTPSGLREETITAVAVADAVILPVSPSALDLAALGRTLKQIKRAQQLRSSPLRLLILPTRINRREKSSRELLESIGDLGIPTTKTCMTERSAYRRAAACGGLAGLPASSRRVALREIEALVDDIEDFLGIKEGAQA